MRTIAYILRYVTYRKKTLIKAILNGAIAVECGIPNVAMKIMQLVAPPNKLSFARK